MKFGVKEAEARLWLQQMNGEEAIEEYPIWACNLEAFDFFNDLTACWVRPALGGLPERIDRGEMVATAQLLGLPRKRWPPLFRQMQKMEGAAREVFETQAK